MVRTPARPRMSDPLADTRRLTGRDRLLLAWLAEHYVLPTEQITEALFPSLRAAQKRLTVLHRIGALSRYAYSRTDTDSGSYRYTLGPLGALLHPHAYHDPDNTGGKPPRSHLQRRARIQNARILPHLLGVNQFFTDLHRHARTHRDAALVRWWSEQHATAAYRSTNSQIRPDGHGIWRVGDRHVGFFLEYDTGSGTLPRLVSKLRAYQRLAEDGGPRYPVLYWLASQRWETGLLRVLHGVATAMPIATAVHSRHPAGPVWSLAGVPGPRRHLHELPSQPAHPTPTDPDLDADPDIGDSYRPD